MKKAIVIGAGFSGCMYSLMLKEKGWDVTVIERGGFIGGGARTFFYAGHPYTYGPHYLNTPNESVYQYISNIVPQRLIDKINYSYQEITSNIASISLDGVIEIASSASIIKRRVDNLLSDNCFIFLSKP